MQGSARKEVVFGAARMYTVAVPGPKRKSWFTFVSSYSDDRQSGGRNRRIHCYGGLCDPILAASSDLLRSSEVLYFNDVTSIPLLSVRLDKK